MPSHKEKDHLGSFDERSDMTMRFHWLCSIFLSLSAGCGGKKTETPAPIARPLVTYTVTEPSESVTRRFSGLLQAAEGASLSFEVAGRVIGGGEKLLLLSTPKELLSDENGVRRTRTEEGR